MPPATSFLSPDLCPPHHFYWQPCLDICFSKFLRLESFFFQALSSQTLLLIKQINIWSQGASTREQPSQPGDLWDPLSWIQLGSLGERDSLSSDKMPLTLCNKSSAGKYNPNSTSLGDGKRTAMTNFMTISFFLLAGSVRMFFQREAMRNWGLVLSEVLRSQCMWFQPPSPPFFLIFFWSQSRERRQATKGGEVSNEVILHTCKHTL